MQIGDVITILRDSKFICEELINKIDIPWITENMVGMKSFEAVNTQKVKKGPKIIELKSISLKKKESEEYILDDVNFNSSSGEIFEYLWPDGKWQDRVIGNNNGIK